MDQHDMPDLPSLDAGLPWQHVRSWADVAAAIGATTQLPTQAGSV